MDNDTFHEYRHRYLKASSQAGTQLTVQTFLTGLTFAAFAAILAIPGIPSAVFGDLLQVVSSGDATPYMASLLLVLCALLLGLTSVLLLLASLRTFRVLRNHADLTPWVAKLLQDGLPYDKDSQKEQQPPNDIPTADLKRVNVAYAAYDDTQRLFPLGLRLLFASLVAIAFRLDWIVGAVLVVGLLVALAAFNSKPKDV